MFPQQTSLTSAQVRVQHMRSQVNNCHIVSTVHSFGKYMSYIAFMGMWPFSIEKGSLCQCFLLGRPIPYWVMIFSTAPGSKCAVLKRTDVDSVNKHHFNLSHCLHYLTDSF